MKLEVGMYIRTNYGIYRIINIPNNRVVTIDNGYEGLVYINEILTEPSHNPINLIEIGDLVNGHGVIRTYFNDLLNEYIVSTIFNLKLEEIETILTKEQYAANAYRVGGNNEKH